MAASSVIGLIGIPGSGKSLIYRRLCEAHGFQLIRFGDPLRDMLRAGFGVEVNDPSGRPLTQPIPHMNNYRPFHLMEKLAEWCRGRVSGDLLAQEWARRVEGSGGLVVADDVQDAHEAAAVRSVGGILVRVTRPNYNPPVKGRYHQRIRSIQSDLELINHGPDELLALADALACEVKSLCDGG